MFPFSYIDTRMQKILRDSRKIYKFFRPSLSIWMEAEKNGSLGYQNNWQYLKFLTFFYLMIDTNYLFMQSLVWIVVDEI